MPLPPDHTAPRHRSRLTRQDTPDLTAAYLGKERVKLVESRLRASLGLHRCDPRCAARGLGQIDRVQRTLRHVELLRRRDRALVDRAYSEQRVDGSAAEPHAAAHGIAAHAAAATRNRDRERSRVAFVAGDRERAGRQPDVERERASARGWRSAALISVAERAIGVLVCHSEIAHRLRAAQRQRRPSRWCCRT